MIKTIKRCFKDTDLFIVENHKNGVKTIYKNDKFVGNLMSWFDVEKVIGVSLDKMTELYFKG